MNITQNKRYISENIDGNQKIISALEDLSYELSTNHCTTSFGDLEREKVFLSQISRHSPDPNGPGTVATIQRHRNILIIGAGASHDSYKCIPLGARIIDELNNRYLARIKEFPAINAKFHKRKADMQDEKRVNELDLESYLSIFSDLILTQDEIRDFLKEFTDFNESPSLFYEVAAHMFKHSFIDVIINFNFDELLDHALEEELGKHNYRFILNDGDCFRLEEAMVDGRLKIPIYIKPHGTISNKSSLRFTKSHYLDMSNEMKTFISDIIRGFRGDDKAPIEKINLISVGFNMESIEFKKILEQHLPHESRIFHFVWSNPDKERKEYTEENYIKEILPNFYKRVKEAVIKNKPKSFENILAKNISKPAGFSLATEIYKRINIYHFNRGEQKNTLTSPFSELFCLLWRYTENQFKKSYVPRSISRHEIISYLFYDSNFIYHAADKASDYGRADLRERFEDRVTYFRDRVLIEIAIAINRNKGIIDIVELLDDRAGIYYQKYVDSYHKNKGKKRGKKLYTFFDLISFFIDDPDSGLMLYSRNIFRLKTIPKDMLKKKLRSFNINRNFYDLTESGESIKIERHLIDKLITLVDNEDIFDKENDITTTLIYHIIRCPILSSQFISNFKKNYNLPCYNGKLIDEKDLDKSYYAPKGMLEELCRLLNKSTRNHYYHIKPKYFDRKNLMVESLSKRKILHTNLSLEYEMRRLMGCGKWDRILTITEVGSYFHFLRHLKDENPLHGSFDPDGKKIIMLNSLDAIYNAQNNKVPVKNIATVNSEKVFEEVFKLKKDFTVKAYTIPFWQHNHHMMIFLKTVQKYSESLESEYPFFKIDENNGFIMIGSFYMYRHGFSNHISPIYIGNDEYGKNINHVNNDFHRLLSLFFMNYQRANAFENINEMGNLEFDIDHYQEWMDGTHFHKLLKVFMKQIVW